MRAVQQAFALMARIFGGIACGLSNEDPDACHKHKGPRPHRKGRGL